MIYKFALEKTAKVCSLCVSACKCVYVYICVSVCMCVYVKVRYTFALGNNAKVHT